jgi:hypothetical protein
LGSIQSQTKAPTAKELEIRKKKKEAEEARVAEVKAERENYKAWVGFQLNSFIEEGREYYEFPPSDSVHRIIAKDEAEERGFVAFSHGEKEEEKRVYVFPDGKGPNELESRFLKHAGTVQELVERRARGDTFKEYNTAFSMLDAKLITKVCRSTTCVSLLSLPPSLPLFRPPFLPPILSSTLEMSLAMDPSISLALAPPIPPFSLPPSSLHYLSVC